MTCNDCRLLLGAYHDNELTDQLLLATMAEHLDSCDSCRADYDSLSAISHAVRGARDRFAVPSRLSAPRRTARPWPAIAVAACLVFLLVGFFQWRSVSRSAGLDALVQSHFASLRSGRLVDVESTNKHNVKPWFQGKILFSPEVPDLSAQGFVLKGGRTEVVRGTTCAVLVYTLRLHVIELYVSAQPVVDASVAGRSGFSMRGWTHGDLSYEAISDATPDALEALEQSFRD